MDDKPPDTELQTPEKRQLKPASQLFAVAMELPFVLVSAVAVGGLAGYYLDRWFHTKPFLLVILGGLGFFAGVREIVRRLPGSGDGSAKS